MATVCEATSVVGSASTRSRATPKRKKIAGAAPSGGHAPPPREGHRERPAR